MERTLDDLGAGERALVSRVALSGKAGRRIREMGVLPGAEVSALGRAPLGDPIAVEVKGYRIALRRDAARQVFVRGNGV